jgi:LEA14-like dessication related protein
MKQSRPVTPHTDPRARSRHRRIGSGPGIAATPVVKYRAYLSVGGQMGLRGAAGLMVLAAALGGCAGLGNALKDPDIRLERVIIRDLDLRGGSLDLVVQIDNPNPFDILGTEVALGFDVEGSHVGDLRYHDDFSVDKGDQTKLTLPLRFQWEGVASTLKTALTRGEIPYMMKGQIRLQTPLGAHSVPFTREGRVPLSRVGNLLSVPTGR